MRKTLKRFLALTLVVCTLLSCTLPVANAEDWDDYFKTKVSYNLNLINDYNKIPSDPSGKTSPFAYILTGNVGASTVQTSVPERYASGNLNWTFEAASAALCGTTTADEHLPRTNYCRLMAQGLRSVLGQDQWIAFRIKSPGAGNWSVKLDFYGYEGSPTVAVYIMEAQGAASLAHDTVLARQEAIHAAMDPDNRVGKANLNAGKVNAKNTAFIGYQSFDANKEYIVVVENYQDSAMAGNYTCLQGLLFTKDGTAGTPLEGAAEVNHIQVQKNVVPAADGGYMTAVAEVNGHDYYFLPLEGGKMAIFDLDKHVAGEESLVATVSTGLYYPTHATVTPDGKVIVGGDGKCLFIFDTKTMTGRTTPDFRAFEGLSGEGHNQGSHYGSDGYLYLGTLYGGHAVQYDMEARTYTNLGDLVCASVRAMAGITANPEEESGGVRATYYHEGFLYAKADSDNYTLIVKVDVAQRKPVAAINVTEQLHGSGVPHGVTVLGDKYLIAGGTSASGMVLIDLATFKLVTYDEVVSKGLFASKTSASQAAWENGMGGHASEVINGKQYFYINNAGLYSYDVATGKMAKEASNFKSLRTGQKTTVTLDMNKDGTEETYLITFSGSGLRLYNVDTKATKLISDLKIDVSAAGGSSINIGTWYDDVLYIGAWNNWNCAAFDTKTETFSTRYVTGGQTDSQTYYVDEDGKFHLISGNYSACVVYEIDPVNKTGYGGDADSNIIKPLIANMKQYDQKRIHTVETGDGYVFAGTIPDSYVNGGGVGVYNIATGTEDFIHFKENPTKTEKCVPEEFSELWDLAVKGIVYSDGRLFGATTRAGGSGSGVVDGTSAQVFVLDYENMAIEATLDLRDYLTLVDADGDGAEDPINYVGGISVDEQGRIWGIVSDVLFCFTYDKTSKTFTVQEVLNLGHSEYQSSGGVGQHNRRIIFDKANNSLFVSFYNAKMQQITLENWKAAVGKLRVTKNEQILTTAPETYALGANGNLYYASGTDLYMKPLNVKSSQWAKAQAVDAQIKALGKITADKGVQVAAARQSYDALSLRDKALVQELRTLLEAEAQILRARIDEVCAVITAEDFEALEEMNGAYMNMTDRQKRYIRNAELLETSFTAASIFNQSEGLNQLQKDIFALEVNTLADTQKVLDARVGYEALTEEQKSVVKLDKLLQAEEKLDALRKASGKDVGSGACGENITWVLDCKGRLTLSGSGAVENYPAGGAPWYQNCIFIQELVLDGDITAVGDYALYGLNKLQTVYFGGTQAQMESLPLGAGNSGSLRAQWHYGYTAIVLGSQTVHCCSCCGKYYLPDETKNVFADISNTAWQLTHAIYACQKGLMAGKGTDAQGRIKFDPNSPISRQEFVQVLYNAEGKPAVTIENPFPDVKNDWYKNAVLWANQAGIASGMGNGSFGVGLNISRQDLAMMLYKYAAMRGCSLDAEEGKIDQFADGSKVSGYAKTAMNWAVTKGILSGKGEAGKPLSTFRLDPAGTATRAECAAMLRNFMTAFEEALSACRHSAMINTQAKPVTCTESGNIAYWYCADCDKYFADSTAATEITLAETVVEAPGHSLSFQKTVAATCGDQGYDLYGCANCDHTEKRNFVPVGDHSYVTMDLETAATIATEAGYLSYARFASDDYCDYDVSICTDCLNIDLGTAHFRYTQREAAEIMLGYVNDLRAEVFGTHAYDLVLDDYAQSLAENRAVQLVTDYSHSGSNSSGECIVSQLSLYEQFIALKNSSTHYAVMTRKDYQYFGYGYATNEGDGCVPTQGFGCMTFFT